MAREVARRDVTVWKNKVIAELRSHENGDPRYVRSAGKRLGIGGLFPKLSMPHEVDRAFDDFKDRARLSRTAEVIPVRFRVDGADAFVFTAVDHGLFYGSTKAVDAQGEAIVDWTREF